MLVVAALSGLIAALSALSGLIGCQTVCPSRWDVTVGAERSYGQTEPTVSASIGGEIGRGCEGPETENGPE